ncbi:hypothetical protein B0J14DRAFT_604741 [Halenospora varia]|nr:hypothetical protein B0J14DRAFT_604741 [Halenospora varia]
MDVGNQPNMQHQCDYCLKSFGKKGDLSRHRKIHTNERPFTCQTPDCGKSFIQRSALKVHNRIHTGEKPYKCQHIGCSKKFSDSSSFARHRRIHTGKPYKCAGCLKSFSRKETMVQHRSRSHQEPTRSGSETSEPNGDDSAHILRPENTTSKRGVYSFASFGSQNTLPFQNSSFYVSEQNNPHVATLNAYLPLTQSPYQLSQEILRSKPSSCSSTSRASPVPQEVVYTLPVQVATLWPQHTSLIEKQAMLRQEQIPPSLGQQHLQPMPQALAQAVRLQATNQTFWPFFPDAY